MMITYVATGVIVICMKLLQSEVCCARTEELKRVPVTALAQLSAWQAAGSELRSTTWLYATELRAKTRKASFIS